MPRIPKTAFSVYKASSYGPYSTYSFEGSFPNQRKAEKHEKRLKTKSIQAHVLIIEEEKPGYKIGEYVPKISKLLF
jgi:predicted sugar kinase